MLRAGVAHGQETSGRVVALAIRADRVTGPDLIVPARGAPTLRLGQGERVALRWTSDRPHELHIHGLRLEARVAPGAPATLEIAARHAGRFAVETHDAAGRHVAILYVEIVPR
jgi:FtsP/CotA-like multicopper oxidase with cupredoxin domain